VDGKSASISKIKAGDFSQRVEEDNNVYFNNRVLRAMHVSTSMKLFLAHSTRNLRKIFRNYGI